MPRGPLVLTNGRDTTSQTTSPTCDDVEGLQALLFLTGSWHSDGQGPFGPYALDATAEIRGRWLLLTYVISEPTSHDVFYVSTQVYGYDNDGLVLELFDTAGSFTFRGVVLDDGGVRFDWKDGDNWKRSEFHPRDKNVDFRYDSMEPEASSELSTFEGMWHPGARTAKPQ
jgi:hypothetical protein